MFGDYLRVCNWADLTQSVVRALWVVGDRLNRVFVQAWGANVRPTQKKDGICWSQSARVVATTLMRHHFSEIWATSTIKMWVLIVVGVVAISLTLAVCAQVPKSAPEFEFDD